MFLNVIEELCFNGPTEEIQFTDGCEERFMSWNLKHDSLAAAIRIKILLGIRFQLRFVGNVDKKLLTVKSVTNKMLTTIVGDKPVNKS